MNKSLPWEPAAYDKAEALPDDAQVLLTFSAVRSPTRTERTSIRLTTPTAARDLAASLLRAADEAEQYPRKR